jgi:biopolymer transport protein ExbB
MSLECRKHKRVLAFLILCTLTVWAMGVPISTVFAQDAGAAATPAPAEESLIVHIIKSAGIVFGPILLFLSMALVALIILLALDLRLEAAIPPAFVQQFTDTVNQRRFKDAFDLARTNPSFLAKVLTGGMSRLQYGLEDARDAALNMVDSIRASKEQINNYTAVICSLGPLIGLVGTVFGMILSFKELAKGGRGVEAAKVADGISHALVITMLGIGIAVPGLFFNAFFRNRITRISMDVANISDDLLTQMYYSSKRPAVPQAAEVQAPVSEGSNPAPTPAS